MATISPSTFDPLLAYVNVRLQQGVPVVDADSNEQDDIRKFELRAFLKWYVGDGAPDGNGGFRITGGLTNDFVIRAGSQGPVGALPNVETALRKVGRYIVDGLDVIIPADLNFSAQPLHEDQPGAAALAARLGVPVIARLTTPGATTAILVELDVWERLLTPDEAPSLVHPGLGVETCARTRREWVVRAYPETPAPARLPGHSYATLAVITRAGGQAVIPDTSIADQRQHNLLVPPSHLVNDVFGRDPYAYRAGRFRPPISLREAINALLAGQLPTSKEMSVSASPVGNDLYGRAVVRDASGLYVLFSSLRSGASQIYLSRLDLARPELEFSAPTQITSAAGRQFPSAVALPNGELVVVYQTDALGQAASDVKMKRGLPANLAGAPEEDIAVTAGAADQLPFAVLSGDYVVIFVQQVPASGAAQWFYRRYRHTDNTFVDTSPQLLSPVVANATALHASAAGGRVWIGHGTAAGTVHLIRMNPDAAAGSNTDLSNNTNNGTDPFVLATGANDATVVYDDSTIRVIAASASVWQSPENLVDTATDGQPALVRSADGTQYLITTRAAPAPLGNEIYLRRKGPSAQLWTGTVAQNVVTSTSNDRLAHPLLVEEQGIWLFWISDRLGSQDVFAKRVITAL